MTAEQFLEKYARYNVTRRKLEGWLKKGLIPGARQEGGAWYIPAGAQVPYTRTRARGGIALYKSIVRACAGGYGVCPDLYGESPERFRIYVNQLIQAGYLIPHTIEGIDYYAPSLKCLEAGDLTDRELTAALKKGVEILSPAIEAAAKGAVKGCAA